MQPQLPEVLSLNPSEIKPYWRNPRKNDAAVDAVKVSILEYGFNQPIVLDRQNVIVVGHTRWRAARALGMAEVLCVRVDLPPEKAAAYRIADNKTAELSEWDMGMLIPELRSLGDSLTGMQVFFPDVDLGRMVADAAGAMNSLPDITADNVAAAQHRASTQFDGRDGAGQAEGIVDLTCPHCAKVFGVSVAEVQVMAAVNKRNAEAVTRGQANGTAVNAPAPAQAKAKAPKEKPAKTRKISPRAKASQTVQ